jgi:hypothetical protein
VGEGWLYRRVHSATGKAPIERWSTGPALYWVDFVFAGNAQAGAYNPILVTFLTLITHMRGSSRHLMIVRLLDASARRVSHASQSNRESDDGSVDDRLKRLVIPLMSSSMLPAKDGGGDMAVETL